MLTLIDDDALKVVVDGREAQTVTMVFSSLGRARLGLEGQGPEFAQLRARGNTLFIMDRRRTWGNEIDFARLIEATDPYVRGKTVNTLGVSMGGFLAILMSRFMRVDTVVAIVPQFTLSGPRLVIRPRSRAYLERIPNLRFASLQGFFAAETAYYAFFGDCPIDRQHHDRFAAIGDVACFRVDAPRTGHFLAQKLRDDEVLYPLIGDCFARRAPTEILTERFAPRYQVTLSRAPG